MNNDFVYFNDSLEEVFTEEALEEGAQAVTKFVQSFDGEPQNINPLTSIPNPEKTLYCTGTHYFDTKEELNAYCKEHDIEVNNTYTMDYIRIMANRTDVIRKKYPNKEPIYLNAIDEDGYAIYNEQRSIYRNEFVWEYEYGNLRMEYSAFRNKGIIFEDDIYQKIDEKYDELLSMTRTLRKIN